MATAPSVLILGIGNLLWADEGFGVRALETLQRSYEFPDNVRLLDGGTQGIYLVQHIREAEILVVFDAVDYGLPGGTLKRVKGTEVPKFMGAKKVSLHQTGFQEVLAMAEMLGDYPEHLLLVGVQPVELEDYGGSLRSEVKAQIMPAIQLALDYLSDLGVESRQREQQITPNALQQGAISDMDLYESERPASAVACRVGDARVLQLDGFSPTAHQSSRIANALSVGLDAHLDKYRDEDSN
ncbi:MAG: HyaD/HybD family hydrogenase maturation endopeptidase [Candidatus Thiodiazotropha sp. (ex Myrtea sp. 'scaly one' KF741663)]|nr:HyaD/HybD family hydrogenase maturation endopeptidase [Candidatus Thiodiazotropha sp. (ex Myrtea sp. 'scaly one' KF741663)]